jgi:hypothetical protein
MINYFKTLFISPRGTLSSKRITGFLMITLSGFLIAFAIIKNTDLPNNVSGLIRDLIYGGVALVGSTIFEKRFKNGDTK